MYTFNGYHLTPLCEIAYKYGTDKCPQIKHVYTPFYYELLNDKRESIKKVLEIGIGNSEDMKHIGAKYDPNLNRQYVRGASLYMWREFFPNAQIYGADILPETIFTEDRISTYLCDETKKEDIASLIEKTGSDIDLFIDDGSHLEKDQIFLCANMMPILKSDVIYIIEDVEFPERICAALPEFSCEIPRLNRRRWKKGRLVVVRHK